MRFCYRDSFEVMWPMGFASRIACATENGPIASCAKYWNCPDYIEWVRGLSSEGIAATCIRGEGDR